VGFPLITELGPLCGLGTTSRCLGQKEDNVFGSNDEILFPGLNRPCSDEEIFGEESLDHSSMLIIHSLFTVIHDYK
jgi:hypothetical protein